MTKYTTTSGRCRPCGVIYQWGKPGPLLREAHCPKCKRPLDRTATALVKNVSIVRLTSLAEIRGLA
jgi:hypothetical protein